MRFGGSASWLVVLVVLVAGCGKAETSSKAQSLTPAQTAVVWLKEMFAENAKGACRVMDLKNHRPIPAYPHWSPARNCAERWRRINNVPFESAPDPGVLGEWGEADPKVVKVHIQGNNATVFVKSCCSTAPRSVFLRNESDRWLVDGATYPI